MMEDGDAMVSSPLDTDTLSPGSAQQNQDIEALRSPPEYIKWDSELKLFGDSLAADGGHDDDGEMALYDDKVGGRVYSAFR